MLVSALENYPHLVDHPHIAVIECFMRYHHERINGKGPQKLKGKDLGTILEIAGIIDGLDGKIQPRPNDLVLSPNDARKAREKRMVKAFRAMTGLEIYAEDPEKELKHAGEFSLPLLMKVIQFYQKDMAEWILPKPATPKDHPALAL